MKKTLAILTLVVLVWSCSKKTTPAKSETATAAPAVTETAETLAGKETYNAKCGRCHGLKDPGRYTEEKWVGILDRMAPKAKLDETEKSNVWAYVKAYSKKG